VLQERIPGPCIKADRLSAFIANSITIRERTWVRGVFKAARQPAEIFDSATACDQRAKQAGDIGSALVVLQLGVAMKLSPIRVAKGELQLIPPKPARWEEDVMEAFRLGRPINLPFVEQSSRKSKKKEGRK
jgi:hypothetical protein